MPKRLAAKRSNFSWKFLLLLFLAVWSSLILICSGVIESEDGWLYLSVAKNIYYNHTFESAPNEYPTLNVHMNTSQGEDGKWRATGATGYSLAMVPAVALSDLTHHLLGTPPSSHFPLEHDWTLHFFASLTNTFYGALLVIAVTLYFFDLTQDKKLSVGVGLLTLSTTNLLPLSKNSFAHIIFTTFVVFCFYFIRKFANTKKNIYVIGLIASYAAVFLSYNVSYYIPILPLILYYFLLIPRLERKKGLIILFGICLAVVVLKFTFVTSFLLLLHIHPKVFLEGLWGFLFSSGKSFFLYSPLLLLPIFFWHKLPKVYMPEYASYLLLSGLYLFLFSNAAIPFVNGDLAPIWHGGMDWGPRYISTLIPFGMMCAGFALSRLTRLERQLVFVPLLLAGLWVQIVAISIPYLLQYRDIPTTITIGNNELSVYDYASFIPRFSPLYIMSKEFSHRLKDFSKTIDHGPYDVRFYDGFEIPLFTGLGPYRGFRSEGHIFLTQSSTQPINSIFVRFYNAQDFPESSSSAVLSFKLNDQKIDTLTVPASGNAEKKLALPSEGIHDGRNRLDIVADYPATSSAAQVVYISQMSINDQKVNLETFDYPDVSTGGDTVSPIPYQYFGKKMNDKWKLWFLRARITERTFDFWWVKNLYYWDRPQRAVWIAFALTLTFAVSSWTSVIYVWKKTKGNP